MTDFPPPPRASPQLPPLPAEPKTDPNLKLVLKKQSRRQGLLTTLIGSGISLTTIFTLANFVKAYAQEAADAGIARHEFRIKVLEQKVLEDQQEHRELYNAVMYGKKSERLEKPVVAADGGQ